jgi:hypothetical protein
LWPRHFAQNAGKTSRKIGAANYQLFAVIRENEIVSARERFNLPVDY